MLAGKIMNISTISKYYDEPHRHYHTMYHIIQVMNTWNTLFGSSKISDRDHDIDKLAIMYHDIVYMPWTDSGQNEFYSSMMFKHHALFLYPEPGIDLDFINRVEMIILDTADHSTCRETSDRVIDCDLSILGSTTTEYEKYVSNTRKEYSLATDEEWKVGRSTFLKNMLAQKRIFKTDEAHYHFGESAKLNLKHELSQLEG